MERFFECSLTQPRTLKIGTPYEVGIAEDKFYGLLIVSPLVEANWRATDYATRQDHIADDLN